MVWRIPNHGDDKDIEQDVKSNKVIDDVFAPKDQRFPFCPSAVKVESGETNRNGGFYGESVVKYKITMEVLTGNPGLSICP